MEFHCALSALKCCQSNQSVQQANVSQVVCLRSKQLLADNVFFLPLWLASDRPNHRFFFKYLLLKTYHLQASNPGGWFSQGTQKHYSLLLTSSHPRAWSSMQALAPSAWFCYLPVLCSSGPCGPFRGRAGTSFCPYLPFLKLGLRRGQSFWEAHSTGSRDSSCLLTSCSC